MQGKEVCADYIAALFALGCRKAGLQRGDLQLSMVVRLFGSQRERGYTASHTTWTT